MAEIVSSVASKVAEYLVAPVGRQCGYVISTDRYVGQLREELEKLDDVRVEVQRSVDHADNDMREIKPGVNRWKNNADTSADKARSLLDNYGRAEKTCLCGWLPNPKGRYCLGRDARKTAQAIQELIPQGKFERVYYKSAPPGLVGGAAEVNSSACDGGDTIQELIAWDQFENPPPGRVGDDGGDTIQELTARGQFEKVDFENPPPVLVGGASDVNSSAGDGGDTITDSSAGGWGMAEIVSSVASKVAEYLVAPVGRQCGYVISTDRYVGQLSEELEKLDNVRVEVQRSVDHAGNDMRVIKLGVNRWKNNAETSADKARSLLDNYGRAEKTCLCGWLPNPKGRYCLGRDARKTAQAIQELIPQGKFERVYYERAPPGLVGGAAEVNSSACDGGDTIQELLAWGQFENPPPGRVGDDGGDTIQELTARGQFEKVDFENPPPVLVCGASDVNSSAGDGGDTITDSRASIFQGIMKALDDEKLKVVGVYGPGGAGKTTLLKEVEKKLMKEGRPFQIIVKAEVSMTPDLNNIQGQIADALSLNLKDKESQQGRRDLLFQRLQKDPNKEVIIILDDLWEELDLKAIGIPSGDTSGKCKLLLASRFRDVLEQGMGADRTFLLEGLSNDEAFRLFETTVGDRLKDEEELRPIAAQVVKKLAGLPLLIISVASTLKNSSVSTWRNALIEIDETGMEAIVKLSYDHLESEEAKSLFLLCGLIGGPVKVELLLGLGMGLGLFEGFNETIQYFRDRLDTLLDSLCSICLLQDGGDGEENVTIHDLYSEVVVSIPFKGQNFLMMNSNYGSWQKEKLEKCHAICLADVGRDRFAKQMMCHFPHLKILMLSQPKNWAHRHDEGDCCRLDFTYMKELRVLYLCSMNITTLPSSIEILRNLRSLYLDRCNVKDVAILGKLKALQILSFAGSEISKLPKEIGELTNLRLLNLSKCRYLKIIEPGVLKGLINLEELHMKGSFDRWLGKDEILLESCNARLIELKNLTKLTVLEISIPNPTVLLDLEDGDMPIGNLNRFWINIGNVDGREFEGLRTMMLKLEGCDSIFSKEWIQKTLQKTQYLHLDGLREFKKNVHECFQGFRQLKHLEIQNSPSIKYIACSSNELLLTAFTILESLFLKNLINLEKICHGPIAPECFRKLKAVSVRKCKRLKSLWCLSEMQRLVQLQTIEVRECDLMQGIVIDDGGKDIVAFDKRVELPNVRHLELAKLPNMTRFCTRARVASGSAPIQVSLPSLESLLMVGLLPLEEILYDEPLLTHNNLKLLVLIESQSASSILKLDRMLKLSNLKSLDIGHCRLAEVVFDVEELKVTGDVELLSQLTALKLEELPNLKRMCKLDVQLQEKLIFRNLMELYVSGTRLEFLFSLPVAKCLREIRCIRVENCPNLEAVIVDEEGRDGGLDDIIEFPLLKRLSIWGCPTKKFFSYSHGKKESITTGSDSQCAHSYSFFDRKVSLPSLEDLELYSVGSFKMIWHSELPRSSFYELATLALRCCSDLLEVFPLTIIGRLHNLKSVEVSECPSLESLFDCGSLDSNVEQIIVLLARLKVMMVTEAGRLRHVVKSDSQMVLGFPSLQKVFVDNCSNLRYLFPNFTASSLMKLESLRISCCKHMKEVVPKEKCGRSKAEVMSFPFLSSLTLKGLDNLISFSSGSCLYEFASLRDLSIVRCRKFEAFILSPPTVKTPLGKMAEEADVLPQQLFNEMVIFPNIRCLEIEGAQCKELWSNQILIDSFCKLEYLKLEHCDNLLHIAPSHIWKRLQRCLEILEVISCYSIEIIYESDGIVMKSGELRTLLLCDLKNLRHIWQYDGLPNVPFPKLEVIEALRCSCLEMVFTTFTAKFLAQIKRLVVESCEAMELIVGHDCEESIDTAITFSELNTLKLYELPNFRRVLPEKYSMEFPSLRVINRVRCGTEPDLRIVPVS